MKALLLAAGYATRLGELTRDRPKPLLPVAQRPIADRLMSKLRAVPELDEIYVVTNHRFAHLFEVWAAEQREPRPIVVDDGTDSDANKRGAVGDVLYTVQQAGIDDDLLILAGDNLFRDELPSFVEAFRQRGSIVGLYDVGSLEKIRRYSAVETDAADRIVGFVEKPSEPRTTLMAIALYLYRREHLPLLQQYQAGGGNMDSPGFFPAWLYHRVPLFGYLLAGPWIDIGNPDEYHRAQELFADVGA